MAIPVGIIVKAAATALTDEKNQKKLKTVVVALLSPVIVAILLMFAFQQAATRHNEELVRLCFSDVPIPDSYSSELGEYVGQIRQAFAGLDAAVDVVHTEYECVGLDRIRIKSVFFSLFFGQENLESADFTAFVGYFYTLEERTREVPPADDDDDDDGDEDSDGIDEDDGDDEDVVKPVIETYIVAVPITNMATVYANLTEQMGMTATEAQQKNAQEVYNLIAYNGRPPDGSDLPGGVPYNPEAPFVGLDGFTAPVGGEWRNKVNSEFGTRPDPLTGETDFHRGIDLGGAAGEPIYAALDGTVIYANMAGDTSSYGNHLAIDHGGGFVTLYAHNTDLLVAAGEQVTAGQQIATMGKTGRVTGIHVHFEVQVLNELQNPRSYLP